MGNGSDRLISLDELIERIENNFSFDMTISDEEKYRRFTAICLTFDHRTTANDGNNDDNLDRLISAIEEPMAYFDTLENKGLAEAVSIKLSLLYEYAFKIASAEKKIVFAKKYYDTAMQCAEFGRNIQNLNHECIAYWMAAKTAEFISRNAEDQRTKYDYGIKTTDASKKAIAIAEKILTPEIIAMKYSYLGNAYKFLTEIATDEVEIKEFAEQWFEYKIKSAELFELIGNDAIKGEMASKDDLLESAYQFTFAAVAQKFLSDNTNSLEEKIKHADRSAQCNIHAAEIFKELDWKEKTAIALDYAVYSLSYISRKIDDTETAISYAKMSYEIGIEAAELFEQVKNYERIYSRTNHTINDALFIVEKSTEINERLEYAIKAYERRNQLITTLEKAIENKELLESDIVKLCKISDYNLYELIAESAETVALITEDISQRAYFLRIANNASKKAIGKVIKKVFSTAENNLGKIKYDAFIQYGLLSIIKRNLYLSVLEDNPKYREEAFSLTRVIEAKAHYLEQKDKLNVMFHLLETELTAYILKEDYINARNRLEQLQDCCSFKDRKPFVFKLLLNSLKDNELESAKALIRGYKDNIEGESSLNHIYKPLFMLHIEQLEQKANLERRQEMR
ncbi:hypothetical protein HZA96_05785 [Candidatus Woesearchaeota archaeon]|nr:hypothetical protein [Candidatus Woesearchaeota archaeon]